MKNIFFTILLIFAPIVTQAQISVPVDGGSVSIGTDGNISGSWEDRISFPGFPDEVDAGSVRGSISPTGQISGSYSGTDTYNMNNSGVVSSISEPYSGSFSGTVDPETGQFTVSWSGSVSGSRSGTLPTSVIPSAPSSPDNQTESDPEDSVNTIENLQNSLSETARETRELLEELLDQLGPEAQLEASLNDPLTLADKGPGVELDITDPAKEGLAETLAEIASRIPIASVRRSVLRALGRAYGPTSTGLELLDAELADNVTTTIRSRQQGEEGLTQHVGRGQRELFERQLREDPAEIIRRRGLEQQMLNNPEYNK